MNRKLPSRVTNLFGMELLLEKAKLATESTTQA